MNTQQQEFFGKYSRAAQLSQQKWGVPASVTLAQAALESGWGQHVPPGSNNFFGIKNTDHNNFVTAGTTEYTDSRDVPHAEQARFECFPTVEDGFEAHGKLLASLPRYRPAMQYRLDPIMFAVMLQRCGYSTNPNYGAELDAMIKRYNLTRYDLPNDGNHYESKILIKIGESIAHSPSALVLHVCASISRMPFKLLRIYSSITINKSHAVV